MEKEGRMEWLLECLIHIIGRAAIKIEEVRQIVGTKEKYVQAYNLCDGTLTLSKIAKKTDLDQGNLSHAVDRWIKNGVAFRYEEGNEVKLLHVFPIPENSKEKPNPRGKKR